MTRFQYRDGDPESEVGPDELHYAIVIADGDDNPITRITEARAIAKRFGIRVIDETDAGSGHDGIWLAILPFPVPAGCEIEFAQDDAVIAITMP